MPANSSNEVHVTHSVVPQRFTIPTKQHRSTTGQSHHSPFQLNIACGAAIICPRFLRQAEVPAGPRVVGAIWHPNGGSFAVHRPYQTTMQLKPSSSSSALRLAEVMAALSLATDLGMGQPLEFALTSCVLATRMGQSLGMPISDLRDVYYFGLLRFIGCNSDTHGMAALLGDELSVRSAFAAVDPGSPP